MTTFAIKDPTSIGVAFLGVGRIGVTHLMTLAGIPNARLVVVADLDPVEAESGRALGHADRATTRTSRPSSSSPRRRPTRH